MMQENMQEKIRKHWEKLPFLGTEMIEVETIKGQKVMIPKKLSTYWENVKDEVDYILSVGQDPVENLKGGHNSALIIPLVKIYLEIYGKQS